MGICINGWDAWEEGSWAWGLLKGFNSGVTRQSEQYPGFPFSEYSITALKSCLLNSCL